MTEPRHPTKAFAAGNRQRDHDKEGVVTTLPDGTRFTAYTPLAMAPEYTADEAEFLAAVERYRRENRRPFPTLREHLAILKSLGYAKPGE